MNKRIKIALLIILILFIAELGFYFIKGFFFPFTLN